MKTGYLLHLLAVVTLLLGVYLFFGNSEKQQQEVTDKESVSIASGSEQAVSKDLRSTAPQRFKSIESEFGELPNTTIENTQQKDSGSESSSEEENTAIDPAAIVSDYISAWQGRDKHEIDRLWEKIADCEKCLAELVDLIVNHKLEEGLDLEVAIKMAALDTDIVLPVFDVMIDPAGSKSAAIILSEKLMNNGRPEFVNKIFDLIYRARISGYDNFAQQLTWVISKLENPKGIEPILDAITGRKITSPELSQHITNVYSKVVRVLPEESNAGVVIANYYLQSNSQEQQRLWPVVSQHGKTLVTLALDADKNGQNNNVQKYANAMTKLPHLESVESLMQLQSSVEYSPDYLRTMLSRRVIDNPTSKVLQKLEDYMRNPNLKLESRLFAAEGLLSVKQNRQARYILEKVINNTEEPDVELQAYIGGRL